VHIHKVEIYNFRSHKETKIELSENINVLIGQNNTGKTSFLYALNLAIGWDRKILLTEDDFFAEGKDFDPKNAKPIKIILEFRETLENRFSDNVIRVFENAIRFDERTSGNLEDPIRFFRICYEYVFDKERDRFVESRYFVDEKNNKIKGRKVEITKEHLSFIPFFYIPSLRDINKEIKTKSSFWGKIKTVIDYSTKKEEIENLIHKIDEIILTGNEPVEQLKRKLQELENNIRITSDAISLHAFTRRSWELLDDLNIYLKLPKANLSLPISKHGAGTQNIIILLIFSAYLEILLPKIIENEEANPIIGIEEPEAHIHPHAQRALFHQIKTLQGQKIISTHSPYVVEQADIYDYLIFSLEDGITKVRRIPKYKKSFMFKFKYGLPEKAYENNKFLTKNEELKIRRYIQFKNSELFFSSLFILCEGDSEKIFLEQIIPYYLEKSSAQLGISIIPCEGRTYSPFLKIAYKEAFDLKWLILSDGEEDTRNNIKSIIKECGYNYDDVKNKIIYLPKNQDFEKYYVSFYGSEKMKEIIKQFYGDKAFEIFKKEFEKGLNKDGKNIDDFTEEQLINIFIDRQGKPKFANQLAQVVIDNKWDVPKRIKLLLTKAKNEVGAI
jgi:putative ATP-dependent endonuclease of OLD family